MILSLVGMVEHALSWVMSSNANVPLESGRCVKVGFDSIMVQATDTSDLDISCISNPGVSQIIFKEGY